MKQPYHPNTLESIGKLIREWYESNGQSKSVMRRRKTQSETPDN